jgi:hypothetical protein
MRRRPALAVIALHGVLVGLLVMGFGHHPREIPEPTPFISLWIHPPPEESPSPEITPQLAPSPREHRATRQQPNTPITAPLQLTTPQSTIPVEPNPDSTTAETLPTLPADWAERWDLAVRRAGEKLASPDRVTFSEPPKTIPKPCKPKESSMEWNGAANPGVHWVGPLPILVTKRCEITIGFFSCTLGALPPPNVHLLDDMKDPNRSRSSVPDPNICD